MSDALRKDLAVTLAPVASANAAVGISVQRLAKAAAQTDDPEKLREAIIEAAHDLIEATQQINHALERATGPR